MDNSEIIAVRNQFQAGQWPQFLETVEVERSSLFCNPFLFLGSCLCLCRIRLHLTTRWFRMNQGNTLQQAVQNIHLKTYSEFTFCRNLP